MGPQHRAQAMANRHNVRRFVAACRKRISLSEMPDRQGQFPSWLEYSQHLANCVNRRWKEHHTEAAYYCIKGIG